MISCHSLNWPYEKNGSPFLDSVLWFLSSKSLISQNTFKILWCFISGSETIGLDDWENISSTERLWRNLGSKVWWADSDMGNWNQPVPPSENSGNMKYTLHFKNGYIFENYQAVFPLLLISSIYPIFQSKERSFTILYLCYVVPCIFMIFLSLLLPYARSPLTLPILLILLLILFLPPLSFY